MQAFREKSNLLAKGDSGVGFGWMEIAGLGTFVNGRGARLDVAVIGITNQQPPASCWRCVHLVNRVLHSQHNFACLKAVLELDSIVQQTLCSMIEDRIADVALVVGETSQGLLNIVTGAVRDLRLPKASLLADPCIGLIGIIKLDVPPQAVFAMAKPR